MTCDCKGLVPALRRLGLTKYEASCYAALVRLGVASAPKLARIGDVPLSRVYETMERLRARGFVAFASEEKPRIYRAVEPATAVNGLAAAQNARIERAQREVLQNVEGALVLSPEGAPH